MDDLPNATIVQAYARLLSLAVHEFRTPASVVGGYLRMLQRDTDAPLSERQRRMVDEAEKSCARLVALIAEMSEVSKLDSGQITFQDEPLDLFAVVQEVAEGVHEAEDREVHLEVRGESCGAPIRGDRARLQSAFSAFFRAILREQPSSCTVVAERRLMKHDATTSAVIVVAEDSNVQTAYNASRSPFDEKRGGMGLALPLARRVIERHGGRVWSPAGDPETAEVKRVVIVDVPLSEKSR